VYERKTEKWLGEFGPVSWNTEFAIIWDGEGSESHIQEFSWRWLLISPVEVWVGSQMYESGVGERNVDWKIDAEVCIAYMIFKTMALKDKNKGGKPNTDL
jgi:hypothetical protein